MLSHIPLFATSWTFACQAPLSVKFSRQESWSGFPFPSPRDLLHPGIEPASPVSSTLANRFFTTEPPGNPSFNMLAEKFSTVVIENAILVMGNGVIFLRSSPVFPPRLQGIGSGTSWRPKSKDAQVLFSKSPTCKPLSCELSNTLLGQSCKLFHMPGIIFEALYCKIKSVFFIFLCLFFNALFM